MMIVQRMWQCMRHSVLSASCCDSLSSLPLYCMPTQRLDCCGTKRMSAMGGGRELITSTLCDMCEAGYVMCITRVICAGVLRDADRQWDDERCQWRPTQTSHHRHGHIPYSKHQNFHPARPFTRIRPSVARHVCLSMPNMLANVSEWPCCLSHKNSMFCSMTLAPPQDRMQAICRYRLSLASTQPGGCQKYVLALMYISTSTKLLLGPGFTSPLTRVAAA